MAFDPFDPFDGGIDGPLDAGSASYADMAATITCAAGVTAALWFDSRQVSQPTEALSGGWPIGQRFRTDEELKSERIRLGIIEQEKSQLEQEAAQVSQERPKQGTEQDVQLKLYLALLNEQIAALEAQEALLLASLRAFEYQAIEEADMVFVMAMMAEA